MNVGLKLIVNIFFAVILANVVTSCISIRVKMGDKPDIAALQRSLAIGRSTRAEVVRVIGEPSGTGRSRLPMQPKTIDLWQYYYAEATMDDSRQMMLFVYFDDDVYQGYLWWSSLDE